MRERIRMMVATLCYLSGIVASIYIGGWVCLIKPIHLIINSIAGHSLTTYTLLICVVKIFLSLTVGGFIWCIGYMGYNYFKGTQDPDWDAINARIQENSGEQPIENREDT